MKRGLQAINSAVEALGQRSDIFRLASGVSEPEPEPSTLAEPEPEMECWVPAHVQDAVAAAKAREDGSGL